MAKEQSFDVVSQVDMQEVDNALQQAVKPALRAEHRARFKELADRGPHCRHRAPQFVNLDDPGLNLAASGKIE